MDRASIVLTLHVTYSTNGVPVAELEKNLKYMITHAVGNGLLTGDTDAEVDEYKVNISSGKFA